MTQVVQRKLPPVDCRVFNLVTSVHNDGADILKLSCGIAIVKRTLTYEITVSIPHDTPAEIAEKMKSCGESYKALIETTTRQERMPKGSKALWPTRERFTEICTQVVDQVREQYKESGFDIKHQVNYALDGVSHAWSWQDIPNDGLASVVPPREA